MNHNKIWQEYQDGIAYNNNIDLYETVKTNEDYYNDKQWGDLNLTYIEQPVLNFIKPAVNLWVALLISDDLSFEAEIVSGVNEDEGARISKILGKAAENVLELTNLKYHNRRAIRNAILDGDSCIHLYFDPSVDTGEAVKGEIKAELIDNTNVYFGDTSNSDVQTQPYIILAYRRLVEQVKKMAVKNGLDPEVVQKDSEDYLHTNVDKETNAKYTTVLRRMWKDDKTGHIWACESVRGGYITKPFDTGYLRYPISWLTWEEAKNSFHGVSPITGKIANQQYINKIYAMGMQYTKMYAFPKVIYDAQKLPGGWNNDIGKAVAVSGNPREAVLLDTVGAGQFNAQAIELADRTLTQTKDLMGASDAALGNVKPDNMGAIIAAQNAANTPLDIQRLIFYHFVDENFRNMLDIMRVNYGSRSYTITDGENKESGMFDFGILNQIHMKIHTHVGQGSYWSELTQIQTLDALQAAGLIPDAITYLEVVPEGYIKNKQKIIDRWKEIQGQTTPAAAPGGIDPAAEAAAAEIANEPLSEEMQDDDLAELLAELKSITDETKRAEALNALKLSEETKAMVAQLLAQEV